MNLTTPRSSSWTHDGLTTQLQLVGGVWGESASAQWIDVENPGKGQVIARVPASTSEDVDHAVAAALAAFPTWKRRPAREHGRLLIQLGDVIAARQEELALLIAEETGNALRTQARGEAASSVDIFRFYGEIASSRQGVTLPLGDNLLSYTVREPVGVVGGIVPWNAPVTLASLKIAMALCMGNTLVLKVAEMAPLAVLKIAEWASEIFPAGVLNVISGTGLDAGVPLSAHPDVAKLTFTGSTGVGKEILEAAASRVVPVTLELGGKSPAIVFPDSDDEQTVANVVSAMRFTRQGQSCTAGSRLFLHRAIYDSFLAKLTDALAKLVIGDPLDEKTDVGAIASRKQFETVVGFIEEAIEGGANLVCGGASLATGEHGYFVPPTIIDGVEAQARIVTEEVFGPVLTVIPWTDEAEMLTAANNSRYGLAGYIFTKDVSTAIRVSNQLAVGWIQVNRGGGQLPGMAYGGIKESGLGREYSVEGALESFTTVKNITIAL